MAAAAALAAPAVARATPPGLFAANYGGTTISQFTIGAGGLLSANGTAPAGDELWMLAVTPDGEHLYGTNSEDGTVSQYQVGLDATLIPLSPATVPTGSDPEQLAVSPNGKNVYVADAGSGGVSVFDVGSDGALGLAETVTTDLQNPAAVVISPSGSSVYVGDSANGNIVEFNRSSNGTLSPKSTPTVPSGASGTLSLVFTPNGKNVYISGDNSSTIDAYSVGSGGELTEDGSALVGTDNFELSVSPSGRNLYASSCDAGAVYQYRVASNGVLSPLVPPSVASGGACPEQQWMTANGAFLYDGDFGSGPNGDVSQFSVSSTGALSLRSTAPAGPGTGSVVIPPHQGPVARFSVKAGRAGQATKFNASKSSDADGKVVRYQWKFGDGHTLSTRKAKVSHKYKKAGKHKVTLTVTDDSGCSTTQVFTGQTAYCNGTKAAKVTHEVKIKKR